MKTSPSEDFTGRSLRGGVVSLAARAVNALVQVASVIVLARLLSPEDYGLVRMVSAIIGIVPLLIDLGTRDAVIQQPHITQGEISTLFWMTFALGCLFAGLVAASGPLIAGFYGEPRLGGRCSRLFLIALWNVAQLPAPGSDAPGDDVPRPGHD